MSQGQPVLVIGASGLVGQHLAQAYTDRGEEVIGTSFSQDVPGLLHLDVRSQDAVQRLLTERRPRLVLLPAAATHVDECERVPSEAEKINTAGVRHVAEVARTVGARLVLFSTDYVFDGQSGPYSESDQPGPLSQYGLQKLRAEQAVAELLPEQHLIVRTTVVFGWERRPRNFVARLVETNRAGRETRVPTDQFGSPTYAPNLAAAVSELDRAGAAGVFHVTGTTQVDRYAFTLLAAKVLGLDASLIHPVTTAELGQLAPRPLRGGLVVAKAQHLLRETRLLSAREGLEAMRDAENK